MGIRVIKPYHQFIRICFHPSQSPVPNLIAECSLSVCIEILIFLTGRQSRSLNSIQFLEMKLENKTFVHEQNNCPCLSLMQLTRDKHVIANCNRFLQVYLFVGGFWSEPMI